MEYNLREIFNTPSLQKLMDKFYTASGIPFSLLDVEGNIHVGAGWQPLCINFHRENSLTKKLCNESDKKLAHLLDSKLEYVQYECPLGLIDCAIPLIIKGEHIASIFTGQFLFEKPKIRKFKKQAKKYGFNKKDYLNALTQVPIVSKEKVKKDLEFLVEFTKLLAQIGIQQIEQKKIEKIKLKAQRLDSLGILAGGIAHDYNNILMSLSGAIELLKASKISENQQDDFHELISIMEEGTKQARDLTKQLITFSKGGTPRIKVESIKQVLKDAVKLFSHGSNCDIKLDLPENIYNVKIDKNQISQVFNNLILNAFDAMPNGGKLKIWVELMKKEDLPIDIKNKKFLKITFSDNGCGIAPESQNKIFHPFYTTKKKGHGLGLAMAYSIIKKHGGFMDFDSCLDKGTNFYVFLPATSKVIKQEMPKIPIQKTFSGNILLMEDDPLVKRVMRKILSKLGFKVHIRENGEKAFALYKKQKNKKKDFDLIITDLTVPGEIGGKDLATLIRNEDPLSKIVITSGFSNDDVIVNYKKYGFNAAIIKPFKVDNFIRMIDKLLHE